MVFYAVAVGKKIGIYDNWRECNEQVSNFSGAIFKKFKKKEDAEKFIICNKKTKIPGASLCVLKKNKEKIKKSKFNKGVLKKNNYYVYTDGACSNNGKINARAGYGIYFPDGNYDNVSDRLQGKQTNNRAELTAIIELYYIIEEDINSNMNIIIATDSLYSIKAITSYGKKNEDINWSKNIANKDLVKEAYSIYKNKNNVKFMHVLAHSNDDDIHSIGNMNADKLAVAGSMK